MIGTLKEKQHMHPVGTQQSNGLFDSGHVTQLRRFIKEKKISQFSSLILLLRLASYQPDKTGDYQACPAAPCLLQMWRDDNVNGDIPIEQFAGVKAAFARVANNCRTG